MIDIYEVVKKLTGPIRPVGETNTDDARFENLKVMTDLIDSLLSDIDAIEYDFKRSHQYSMKKASEFARDFQDRMRIIE